MNETIKTILSRRSIRAYKPQQLKDEELQDILQAGQYAPSAINQQPWMFTVVQNAEILGEINQACRDSFIKSGNPLFAERAKDDKFSVFYNAPTLILVSGDTKAVAPQIDCAVALENMFLAAASLNIGSCWIHAVITLINSPEGEGLKKKLGIPEDYSAYACGCFGYKAMEAEPAARKEYSIHIIK